jgi:N-acetylglucosaminyldiphosphoundecaprenol N-acetyl-beta-D-mannosaminyltransferase
MSSIPPRVRIGHLEVDRVTFAQALDTIEAMVASRSGGVVFTPNVDHVVMAGHDERFRRAYESADLSLADGVPVIWASRLMGQPLPAKISGSDLVLPLMDRANRGRWRVFLLGGGPGVVEDAAVRLTARFPDLVIAGTLAPRVDMQEPASTRADVLESVRLACPDIVLVALGAPKQELWIAESAEALRPAVLLGVGAAVDFLAGTVKRAPGWISASGLEWLYRLAREPSRLWKRYLLRDPEFLLILLDELRRGRRERRRDQSRRR